MVGATSLAANVALQRNGDGLLLAQATSEDASVLGLVRLHLEPSRAVSLLDRTTKLAAAARRRLPSAGHPPLDDERTYRLLASGATLGVPGLEGSRAQSLLRRLQPARFNDLRTALALLHAAARGHETQGTSASLVNGWPELQAQLQDTHGFLLFEEQVLEIAANLAGFQQATAESLHAAVCQRDWRALGKLRPAFLSGAVERGAGVEQAEALFARLVAAQGLLVSRARMTALAIQAYRAAFLSAHAPEEFFTVLLDLSTGQSARADSILREAVERQVRLLDVDVQRSAARPQLERDAIRLGFVQVRHVGESLAGRIVANRSQQGPFTTLASFRRRLPEVPDRAVASLIAAGAFASLGVQRGARVESKRTGRRRRVSSSQQLELGFMSGASSRSKSVVGAEVRHGSSRHGISKLVARSTAADAAKAPSVQGHGEALGGGNAEPAPDAPAKLWILGRIRARA